VKTRAFTLIEMIMALSACAVILAAIYGVFSRAIHLRNDATMRARDARVRAHAAAVIANDLRNGWLSGGKLAAQLTSTPGSGGSSFPGYLKLTATTARQIPERMEGTEPPATTTETMIGDVQQIEYYIVNDPEAAGTKSGMLVRAVDTNILAPAREAPVETPLLRDVEAIEVSFFEGTTWVETWPAAAGALTPPEAVRIVITQASHEKVAAPPPLEVLVKWTAQPLSR